MNRRRNHWGWGWADKYPSLEARRNLGQMVSATLGFALAEPDAAVPLDAVELNTPAIDDAPDFCTDGDELRIRHTYGRSYVDLVRGYPGGGRAAKRRDAASTVAVSAGSTR